MEEKIRVILINVNDWLKFAESKNAVLILFNGGAIYGVLNLYLNLKIENPNFFKAPFIVYMVLSVLSILILLLSFLPQTKLHWLFSFKTTDKKDNLLFYAHIAKYDEESYLKSICKYFGEKEGHFSEYEKALANQIINNSKIALKKYYYFKASLFTTILAIIIPGFLLIIKLII